MPKFQVGEIAIVYNPGYSTHGMECTILQNQGVLSNNGRPFDYAIEIPDHPHPTERNWVCWEKELRKKRPPEADSPGREWFEKLFDKKGEKIKEEVQV